MKSWVDMDIRPQKDYTFTTSPYVVVTFTIFCIVGIEMMGLTGYIIFEDRDDNWSVGRGKS